MLEQNRVVVGDEAGQGIGSALAVRVGDPPGTGVEFGNSTLTEAQVLALRALAGGASPSEAARAAGVERMTLYRWRTRNAQFIAAMNAWRQEQLEDARDQIRLMRDAALESIRQGMAKGDARLGLMLLDRMGASAAAEIGPTLPKMIDAPEIERPFLESMMNYVYEIIKNWPEDLQRMIPMLFDLAARTSNNWGMHLLKELAEEYRARTLTPEQCKRVPDIILTALDAEAAILKHRSASEGGVS